MLIRLSERSASMTSGEAKAVATRDLEPASNPLEAVATALQRILRAMRMRGGVHVRAGKDHLTIESEDRDGARRVVGRAVPAEGGSFQLKFLRKPGEWADHPAAASLEDLAFAVLDLLHLKEMGK